MVFKKKIIFLSFSSLSLCGLLIFQMLIIGCGKQTSTDLELSVVPSGGTILDYNFETCNSRNFRISNPTIINAPPVLVNGPVIMFNKIALKWHQNYRLHVQSLNINFDTEQFKVNCSLPPDEIASLFLFSGSPEKIANSPVYDGDGFITSGTITSTSSCKIVCEAKVQDKENLDVSGTGYISVKGTSENGDVFARVKTRASVSVTP